MNPKHKALPCAALLLALAACDDTAAGAASSTPTASQVPLVRVRAVELQHVQQSIETTSYLESRHRVTVLPKIAGRVLEVAVDEGDRVEKGAVLARFDQREAESALRQIEVQKEERQLRHELAKLESEASQRRTVQARVDRDRAKADYDRNKNIDPALIPPKELDDSKFALDSAEEALKVAAFNEKKAALEVSTAQNAIDELSARLQEETLRLAEHTILSPIDGVIEMRGVRGGETVGTSTELFVVVDRENLVSYLNRPQMELPLLEQAKEVTFSVESFPDRVFRAKIDLVLPTVDQASGSVRVRIAIRHEDAAVLRPGMFIRAEILTEDNREALMVPKAALVNEIDRTVVYVVRNGIAHRVVMELGLESREWVECRNLGEAGIAPGDQVVISGQQDLDDQSPVEISSD